ncbi:amino acid adenylation domain-containing protein, partial [Acidobacteriota bacterium]
RHEALRTVIRVVDFEPCQRVLEADDIDIEDIFSYLDFTSLPKELREKKAYELYRNEGLATRFDLSRGPLFKIKVIRVQNDKVIICLLMHHVIADNQGAGIIWRDMVEIYNALVSGKKITHKIAEETYLDFAKQQNESYKKGMLREAEEYWRSQFSSPVSRLNLPTDFPPPVEQSYKGASCYRKIEQYRKILLEKISIRNRVSLLTIFLSAYYLLLYKYTSNNDLIVGTMFSGRDTPAFINVVGLFVNTVALRVTIPGDLCVKGFVKLVNKKVLDAYKHQYYPLEKVVDFVGSDLRGSNISVFQTTLQMIRGGESDCNFVGLKEEIPGEEIVISGYSAYELSISIVNNDTDIDLVLDYRIDLFKKETIERMMGHLEYVLDIFVKHGEMPIGQIDLLSEEERQQILLTFNDTGNRYPVNKTIQQVFEEQVERTPDNPALVCKNHGMTYKKLNERVNQAAHYLRIHGVKQNTIVSIIVERSLAMFIGILGILKAGGAYLPIAPGYPRERICFILDDSSSDFILTQHSIKPGLEFTDRERINLDDRSFSDYSLENPVNINGSNDLMYTIYTSGSTGLPKGCMLEYQGVINRIHWMQERYSLCSQDSILHKTPFTFDVSVWELFWWIWAGARCVILPPQAEKDPETILTYITNYNITTIHFVPPMLNAFVDYVSTFKKDALQQSKLNDIFCSGEALGGDSVQKLKSLDPGNHIKVHNLYGPTEASIDVSYFECTLFNDYSIPIGKPISNINLYIIDRVKHLQPIGVPGEICISGIGLARGYINSPGLTNECFIDNPFNINTKMYRTGDVGRWLADGNIEYLSRLDNQVKIRGFRVEPGEIEFRLLSHHDIKEAVVITREGEDGDKYLCAYFVSTGNLEVSVLQSYLSQLLPGYMIPSYFLCIERIPLTPNGKVDRNALPGPKVQLEKTPVAPRNKVEEKVADLWSEMLGIEKEMISINGNFFQLGGHSLKAIALVSRIHKAFDVRIPLAEVFKKPTIRALAEYIHGTVKDKYTSIKPTEKKDYYVLSPAQKRMYVLQQVTPGSTGYNISMVSIFNDRPQRDHLEKAVKQLIRRHESLRTSFHLMEDGPGQKIHENVEFEIEYYNPGKEGVRGLAPLPGEPADHGWQSVTSTIKNFIRPFDLSHEPLLRIGLIHLGTTTSVHPSPEDNSRDKYILLVDMHHIISDGISIIVLINDFLAFYRGEEPADTRVQYKDFSEWQNSTEVRESIKEQEEYWIKEFEDEIPVLDLPTDYARPAIQRFEGSAIHFEIGKKETNALKKYARDQGATLYMVLLSLTIILLSKLSSQEDIIIGTPVAGRRHADLEKIIGMFVNTLPLRNHPTAVKNFNEFSKEVKERSLKALENQEYPFEELVDRAAVNRDTGRNPLFDVMFVFQNFDFDGASAVLFEREEQQLFQGNESSTVKFDMTLNVSEDGEGLALSLQYSTALFKKETVQRFTGYFKKIVSVIVNQPDITLGQIEIISREERKQVLDTFNDTHAEYPKDTAIHQLFEEQVKRTPDNIAVVGPLPVKHRTYMTHMTYISYLELNKKSNQLAYRLKEKGVESDTIVAIMVEPSIEMIAGILGILKAGAAYLPIEPEHPRERIDYMMADSAAKILLTADAINCVPTPSHLHLSPAPATTVSSSTLASTSTCQVSPANLAYIIYTSGTTGKPKGVVLEQKNLVNYVHWFTAAADITGKDKTILTSSFAFDLGYTSLYTSLLNGGELHILTREIYLLGERFLDYIGQEGISYIKVTPSLFSVIVNGPNFSEKTSETLRLAVIGGEAINVTDIEKAHRLCPLLRVMNHYGPTEATIGCVALFVDFHHFEEYK